MDYGAEWRTVNEQRRAISGGFAFSARSQLLQLYCTNKPTGSLSTIGRFGFQVKGISGISRERGDRVIGPLRSCAFAYILGAIG